MTCPGELLDGDGCGCEKAGHPCKQKTIVKYGAGYVEVIGICTCCGEYLGCLAQPLAWGEK